LNITLRSKLYREFHLSWLESDPDESFNKPTLIFLHGFPDNSYAWEKQIKYFAGNFRIIAPFIHGTNGDRMPGNRRYSIESYSLDLLSLLMDKGITDDSEVYIVAHDLGGVIAERLTHHLTEIIKGVVFINSMGLYQFIDRKTSFTQIIKSWYIFLFQLPLINKTTLSFNTKKVLKKIYDSGGVEKKDPIRQNGAEVFSGIELYRQYFKSGVKALKNNITPINNNVLFIFGEDDAFLNIPSYDEVEKFYNNFEIRVVDGNHWIQRSSPDRINKLIQKSLTTWSAS
jgi:epoxide hydrolase 4